MVEMNFFPFRLVFFFNFHIPFSEGNVLITSEQSERSSYWHSYMGRLDDIQTTLKPLQKN